MWFTDTAIAACRAEPRTSRRGQSRYSALAIATALTLRSVFRWALRQTEGLIGSIIALLGLDLAVPDHTTLSRRAESLDLVCPRPRPGPVHLLVDSTGSNYTARADGRSILWLPYRTGPRVKTREVDLAAPGWAVVGYSRAQALAERAVLPVLFSAVDGEASWLDEARTPTGPHRLASRALALLGGLRAAIPAITVQNAPPSPDLLAGRSEKGGVAA